jgi:polyvinyl alcohol dehydrogenase (cytochrome)
MLGLRARKVLVSCLVGALGALLPAVAQATDWPTYHGDNTRQGNDTSDPNLASPAAGWTSAPLDGNVYGQPLAIGTQVIVATENNTVYSLNATNGAVNWNLHLGAPRTTGFACGNINPLGITGTPVVDGGNVFVAAEIEVSASPLVLHFELASITLSGALNWIHIVDPPDPNWANYVQYEQERGALLAIGGRIVVPLGGLFGDCGSYHGYVLSYAENNTGSVTYWADAEIDASNNQGGIWAAGGTSSDGTYAYAATGNSNHGQSTDAYDYSDGVIKLDPNALAPGAPFDFFAPSTWYADNQSDVDLGSTVPLQLPNSRVLIVGKSGNGYLLNSANLGHINGQMATHRVCHATNDAAFGSLAYANGIAYVGCSDGLAAIQINGTSSDFSTLWYNTANVADHPPTIAGGMVWAIGGANLLAFNPTTGALMHSFAVSSNHFTTPTAANGQLYVSSGTHVFAFTGCGGTPLLGDFTGGGKSHLAMLGASTTCVLLSTGTAFSAASVWSSTPFFGAKATLSGDISGDGKSDVVAVNATSTWVMISTGAAFNSPAQWANTPFYGARGTFLADVDGDGKADLVAVNDNSVWVMLSTGSAFATPVRWSSTLFYGTVTTLADDVSGDGKADLVAVNSSSTWVMTSTGTAFGAPTEWSGNAFYGSKATRLGDVNGDGKRDLIAVNGGSSWVMVSSGTGFGAPIEWSNVGFFGTLGTRAADVTGDAKADLVAVNADSVWVEISSGTGFGAPTEWLSGAP